MTSRLDPRAAAVVAAARCGVPGHRIAELVAAGDQGRLDRLGTAAQAAAVPDGAFVTILGDPGYPAALAAAPQPPPILYGLGDLGVLARSGVAITGPATPSVLGATVAEVATSAAAHAGAGVLVDAAAGAGLVAALHAIQYAAPVTLVLATGPDRPATPVAADLARDVLAAGGVVISEHPYGTGAAAAPGYTPAGYADRIRDRHRIVSGLCAIHIPTAGTLGSDTCDGVWTTLAAGRPVVVARPRPKAAADADAQLALALAHPQGAPAGTLRRVGCPAADAATIAARAPLASAVAADADELAAIVETLWRLSPFVAADSQPRTRHERVS